MSADNYTRCPRCKARARTAIERQTAEVRDSYGSVSAEEYAAATAAIAKLPDPEKLPHSFREDYEIYGAEGGAVNVDYSGSCRECGLELSFTVARAIPGVGE